MRILYHFGRYLKMLGGFFKSPEKFSVYWRLFLEEANSVGVGSLVIVTITSVFIGAVMAIQTSYQLESPLLPTSLIGTTVLASSMLEFAPTITALVLAGKVGSSMAGHLGTMRITEQIDALEVMGINSSSYLVLPKITSFVIMMPCLVGLACFLMLLGAMAAGDLSGAISVDQFIQGCREYFIPFHMLFMLTKAVTFGFVISSVSSYHGFYTTGGALEVGQSSTRAVVYSVIMILVADYTLAAVML